MNIGIANQSLGSPHTSNNEWDLFSQDNTNPITRQRFRGYLTNIAFSCQAKSSSATNFPCGGDERSKSSWSVDAVTRATLNSGLSASGRVFQVCSILLQYLFIVC